MIDVGIETRLMAINSLLIMETVNGDIWQCIWYAHVLRFSVDSIGCIITVD